MLDLAKKVYCATDIAVDTSAVLENDDRDKTTSRNPYLGSRLEKMKFQEIYNEDSSKLVYMHYKEDMVTFSYEF